MRDGADGRAWDRVVPAFVLPYAIWTIYVHLIVASHASFTTLMRWLPPVLLLAVAATVGWFRLRDPAVPPEAPPPPRMEGKPQAVPLAVLAVATLWVGLLSAGLPYGVFWWVGLLAMGGAWARHLRGGPYASRDAAAGTHPAWIAPTWIVPCVVVAAVCVVLVAHRPDADDALHLSIPATLLRFPERAVLLHDTMYRLPETPMLLPFYRLANYDILAAVFARTTGIDHLVVAYLILPSLFAAICVLAWVYLLRRIVPARWPVVLPILFVCVLVLGEAHRAYGNFAFVRLFQGKAILASCMVPAITGAALGYARHGGIRHWLLLLATQIAALGFAASAMFVAPAAAALGLAGGWSADMVRSRRFLMGLLATAYVFGAAWLVATGTRGEQVLAIASPVPMPSVPDILNDTWGKWSTRLLLVALFAAWAFVRDPVRARYFSAGAFLFLLVALNPYTIPFVAAHGVGAQTYWRLTWALPLPFFLAVVIDGLVVRVAGLRPRTLAVFSCTTLIALSAAFASRFGIFRSANSVTLGVPGLNVPPVEYGVARKVAEHVPEGGTVLAPEAVASWLPIFVVHPNLIGVRQIYLSLAFPPRETAQRSNMMRYVAGAYRPPHAEKWFAESMRHYHLTAVVFRRSSPWGNEIERVLGGQGWRTLSCGTYETMVQGDPGPAMAEPYRCGEQASSVGR